jgi:hypothetical protein
VTAIESALQSALLRRPLVISPYQEHTTQWEWIEWWEEDNKNLKTPIAWNDEFQAEEDRLMAIREDVILKKADAKGAIILFARKKAHWEEKVKKAEARFADTCHYFIHVYTKNIDYFQNLSSLMEQRSPEPAPDMQMSKLPLEGIDDLISQGWIAADGRRVIGDLNNVAAYLAGKKVNITSKLIKLYFRKSDGTEYSDSAITQAVNHANTQ